MVIKNISCDDDDDDNHDFFHLSVDNPGINVLHGDIPSSQGLIPGLQDLQEELLRDLHLLKACLRKLRQVADLLHHLAVEFYVGKPLLVVKTLRKAAQADTETKGVGDEIINAAVVQDLFRVEVGGDPGVNGAAAGATLGQHPQGVGGAVASVGKISTMGLQVPGQNSFNFSFSLCLSFSFTSSSHLQAPASWESVHPSGMCEASTGSLGSDQRTLPSLYSLTENSAPMKAGRRSSGRRENIGSRNRN